MRFGLFPAAIVVLVGARAQAQSASPATPRSDRVPGESAAQPEQTAAHEHFERALTWYRAGKYGRAIEELDAALARDPGGKDLVFNLALVQEKLGDLAGAIHSLERFQSMEKDPAELDRAAQTIQRLEGARAELLGRESRLPVVPSAPAPCPAARTRGKFDAWVVGVGSFAIASWLVGSAFGVRALTLDARSQQKGAHDAAVIADFALATGLLAGAGTMALYFGRYADVPVGQAFAPLPMPRISAARFEFRY